MTRKKPQIFTVQTLNDSQASIGVVENIEGFDDGFNRVYFLYDIPIGSERGGHSHKDVHQFLVAISGNLDIELDNGRGERFFFNLDTPTIGLYIPPGF
jgi:hypothetical protein